MPPLRNVRPRDAIAAFERARAFDVEARATT
jgi:hypothetical protein